MPPLWHMWTPALSPTGKERGAESGLSRRARAERWSQWSLRGGMESLPEALAAFLRQRGVELHCHAPLRRLHRRPDGRWQVRPWGGCWGVPGRLGPLPSAPPHCSPSPQLTLADGTVTADHVVSALPAAGRGGGAWMPGFPRGREDGGTPPNVPSPPRPG